MHLDAFVIKVPLIGQKGNGQVCMDFCGEVALDVEPIVESVVWGQGDLT